MAEPPSPPRRTDLIEHLARLPEFHDLGEAALIELAQGASWREYVPDEVVFLEGDPAAGLFLLSFGWLKVVKGSAEGREQVLRLLGPGETFNEIGAFTRRPTPATAIALEHAGAWQLRQNAVMDLARREPDLAQRMIESMADRIVDLVNLVADLSLRTVSGRLARLLIEDAVGDVVARRRWETQGELASRLGTVPDVVQRALRGLEAERLIATSRQEIRILNRAGLEKLAQ
ncbi:MAG: Crp/Fnr family transcriptional regulator [Thermoflexales bacterium]|nr:Crp/Fnr family transcriptional regulator [Thermoflexales bacterium]